MAIGSAVREGVASDDLDILVLCTSAHALKERAPLEIDLRAFDIDSVDDQIESGHDILGWAVVFGRPMFDRNGVWRSIVQRWEDLVPLPDPDVARTRATATHRRMQEMREMGDDEAALELEVAFLSHQARAALAEAGVYPASRPELPGQLAKAGAHGLAADVSNVLAERTRLRRQLVG